MSWMKHKGMVKSYAWPVTTVHIIMIISAALCSNIHSFKQQQWVTEPSFLFVSQNNKDILLELQLLASDDSTVFSAKWLSSHHLCWEVLLTQIFQILQI